MKRRSTAHLKLLDGGQELPRPKTVPDPGEEARRLVAHLRAPRAPDPTEQSPMDAAELEALRDTAVGRAFGISRAWVSRDGLTLRIELGGGPT